MEDYLNYTTTFIDSITTTPNYTTTLENITTNALSTTTIPPTPKSDSSPYFFLYITIGIFAFITMLICFIIYVQRKTYRMRHGYLLLLTENGYGKRIKIKSYRPQKRGGVGVKTVKNIEKVGNIISLRTIIEEKDLIAISRKGKVIRVELKNVSEQSRVTQGVRLMKLDKGDSLASIICI